MCPLSDDTVQSNEYVWSTRPLMLYFSCHKVRASLAGEFTPLEMDMLVGCLDLLWVHGFWKTKCFNQRYAMTPLQKSPES